MSGHVLWACAIVGLAIVAASVLHGGRYSGQVMSKSRYYVVDRWTGETRMCTADARCVTVRVEPLRR